MTTAPVRPAPVASLAGECRGFMAGFPTGVVVVTTIDGDGSPQGLTCSSLLSVTLDPPTLLVSLRTGSRTLAAIEARRAFAVNLLHVRGQRAAEVFATGRPDRFDVVRWEGRGDEGLPWLPDDACGFAACALTEVRVVGDHTLVLGEAIEVDHHPDVPLLYGLRQYSAWRPTGSSPA